MSPIVSIKQGNGRIIEGSIKLVHITNTTNYEQALNNTAALVQKINRKSILKPQLEHLIKRIQLLINRLKGTSSRNKRSINWLGSAWKWIAGTPDATDWDSIVKSQNDIISSNNQQYRINRKLMESTSEIIQQHNKIVEQIHSNNDDKYEQVLFNKLNLLRNEISEIVLAEHLAKAGIVNSNLLDKDEVNRLLSQIETLPYENIIQALVYAEPIMVTKGDTLLYIISLPKTSSIVYDHILVRPTTKNKKRVHLQFKELLVNQAEHLGIKTMCNKIGNTTICREDQVEKLPKTHCISTLMRGLHAVCDYEYNKQEVIEEINNDTVFLDNFSGEVFQDNSSKHLRGTFMIQYSNETIKIKGKIYISREIKSFQVLPTILQPIPAQKNIKLDVDYLHDLHLNNTLKLQHLQTKHGISLTIDISIISALLIISLLLVHKFRKEKSKLRVIQPTAVSFAATPSIQDLQPIRLNF